MIHAPRLRAGHLLVALSLAVLAVMGAWATLVPPARANGYGELTRFGEDNSERETETEAGRLSEARTLGIGVDPEESNSVFVLEEKKNEAVSVSGTEVTRFFRLKKFKSSGGKYTEAAHVDFKETSPHLLYQGQLEKEEETFRHEHGEYYEPKFAETEKPGVNGLVVDAKLGRVYLLTSDQRQENIAIDRWSGKEGPWVVPPQQGSSLLAASTLYAFSTKESGSELVPAPETTGEGVLTPSSALEPQSTVPGKALLSPSGIALDPASDEVVVLAHEDSHGYVFDNVETSTDHYVLQRIKSNGQLGARYVDSTNKLVDPSAPVVVPGAKGQTSEEHVLVNASEGLGVRALVEEPENFASTEAPKALPLSEPLNGGYPEIWVKGLEKFTTGLEGESRQARPGQDGSLTVSPEGTVFGLTRVEQPGLGYGAGILALSGSGEVIGWTGGAVSQGSGTGNNHCVIEPQGRQIVVQLAAGSGGTVFALAPEFLNLREEEETEEEVEPEPGEKETIPTGKPEFPLRPANERAKAPAIVEFGPGGSCTKETEPEAQGPEAEINGTKVSKAQAGTEVRFTSTLAKSDATKVEWTFELKGEPAAREVVVQQPSELRGAKGLEPEPYRTPGVNHAFDKLGQWNVTEKIYTDSLNDPSANEYESGHLLTPSITLTMASPITIEPGQPRAQFVFTPSSPTAGQEVSFESRSTDPNGAQMEYTWEFGDGVSSPASKTTTVKHTYAAPGSYTVKLTVKDSDNETSSTTHVVIVSAEGNNGGGGGGGGGGNGNGGGGNGNGGNGGGGGQGGVLSYNLSVLPSGTVSVSSTGALSIKVSCTGQSSCSGTVALKTATAVLAGAGKHKKKQILTLATGSFSLAGGQGKRLTLHLSAAARALLVKDHSLRVHAVVNAHDYQGNSHSTTLTITLKLVTKHKK